MDILLVEDNSEYLDMIREALASCGYTVHTALDGGQGCEVLNAIDIDLIISDIRMPKFDGLKLHAFARETERYRSTSFIFLTGLREYYAEKILLNPHRDFVVDKTTPLGEILRLIDRIFFGTLQSAWV